MARKHRRAAAISTSVRNRSGDPAATIASPDLTLASLRNIQALNSLAPAFVRWYAQEGINIDVAVIMRQLTVFFAITRSPMEVPQ